VRAENPLGSEPRYTRIALAITYGLNPLVIPVLALTVIAWHESLNPVQTLQTLAIGGMGFVLLPGLYLAHLVRTGRVKSMEVRSRQDRTGPMLVGMAGLLLVVAGLHLVVKIPLLTWLTLFQIGTGTLVMGITRFWKISIHQIGITGPFVLFAGLEVFPVYWNLVSGILLVTLVGGSRLYLRAHTFPQVVGGTVLGALSAAVSVWGALTILGH